MLLSEQLRVLADEEVLYTGGPYDDSTGPNWVTKATKQITLSATRIVYVRQKTKCQSGDSAFLAVGRVLLDDKPIITAGKVKNGEDITRDMFLVLGAGSYTFKFQCNILGSAGTVRTYDLKIASLNFPDKQRNYFNPSSVACPHGTETTVLNENFTPPTTRKTPVGSIKKYVGIITVVCEGGRRKSFPKNPGEGNSAGFNYKIYMDNTQVSWTERRDDWGDTDTNSSYGKGAYGRYVAAFDPNVQVNLKIKVYNNYGSTQNCLARVELILCPWILADVDYEPVSLNFADGSTLYVVAEPLNENPTKYVRIGKTRFNSFGDTSDYYASSSGTGIIAFDYTFEMVEVVNSVLHVKGLGGCVGIIGVDVR